MGNLAGPGSKWMVLETSVAIDEVQKSTARSFTIDRTSGDHWIELGRFANRDEADVRLEELVAKGSDRATLRVRHAEASGG
jgi:hypothetical protein